MPIIATHELKPNAPLGNGQQLQAYCGLDCCVTTEVYEELLRTHKQLPLTYAFERALQAPLLEMMLRGFRVDEYARQQAIIGLRAQESKLDSILHAYAMAIWDKPLNPRSPKQLIQFFYGHMKLPEQWKSVKGQKRLSTDREALEKLEVYFYARPIIAVILAIRDVTKQLSVLEQEIDYDGRIRTSYNMSTETGRLSSSKSVEGTGGNLQNLSPKVRQVFIADEGWKLCGIDLEQTESHDVGWLHGILLGDWSYLNAVEAGDIHTAVCKMIWKDLAWTGNKAQDRRIADKLFYREFSYRDLAKRGGHASNYMTTPWTMSRALKIPLKLAEQFQLAYYSAFPAFQKWFRHVAEELQTTQRLTTPLGRTRQFFGRPTDGATLREGVAFCPQATTADRMNLGLWRVWHAGPAYGIRLLTQVHDAIYFLYRPETEAQVIPWALKLIEVPITNNQRTMIVRGEAKVGWNWGNYSPTNLDGLKKWSPLTPDTRVRTAMLDRKIS